MHLFIIKVKNLVVKMNVVYIKEMINNSNLQLNAIINRWIVNILLFDFELQHILTTNFKCVDELLRWLITYEDLLVNEEYEDWINKVYEFVLNDTNDMLRNDISRESIEEF